MTSTFGWLDTSAEQRRQAQEIIALFTQAEGRDEIGIGTIRDAISNLIFPGTSVLLTRARYCLFIPWAHQVRRARTKYGPEHLAAAERVERELIGTLIREEPQSGAGVIGRNVGPAVKNLPSVLYWVALTEFGIVRRKTRNQLGLSIDIGDDPTELAERADPDWHPDLPPAPKAFPYETDGGFALSNQEANWLRDRITLTCPGTPLKTLLTPAQINDAAVAEMSAAPFLWQVPRLRRHPEVMQAELFSTTMHGAALLYNLLVAQRCEEEGLTRFDGKVDEYVMALEWWARRMHEHQILERWDLSEFWSVVQSNGFTPYPRTRDFVDGWVRGILSEGPRHVAENDALRKLVERQEQRKGKQSRLLNERMLPAWSGASAADQLTFRWGVVRQIAADIFEGLMADA